MQTFSITDVAYRGSGIAKNDGIVTFIPGTIPGETVTAEIVQDKKRFREARLIEVLTPSHDRTEPCCRLSNGIRVPGCVYDHMKYEREVEIKDTQLRNFMRRLPLADNAFLPPFASPSPLGYRNKIVFHAQRKKNGELRIGYIGDDNKTVTDIEKCPLAKNQINYAWAKMRPTAKARMEDGDTITLRYTEKDGVVSWINKAPTNGQWLTEQSSAGELTLPPDGFYQVNSEVASALQNQVSEWLSETAADGANGILLDLYCGVGVFALSGAAIGFKEIIGIESGRNAVKAATRNAAKLGIKAEFICEAINENTIKRLVAGDLEKAAVVIDPPRHGMDSKAVTALAQTKAKNIIYVSCDPSTLTRDLNVFAEHNFKIFHARVFDMFPRTLHFESAVMLKRR